MSLRTRLVLVLGTLAVVGLLAADLATYYSLRSFLVTRVDNSLVASANVLSHSPHIDPSDFRTIAASNPGGWVGVAYGPGQGSACPPNGVAVAQTCWAPFHRRFGESTPPPPKVPANVAAIVNPNRIYERAATHGPTRFPTRAAP